MKSARQSFLMLSGAVIAATAALALTGHNLKAEEAKLNKEEVRTIVHDYLIEHPEVLVEALDSYQANQQEIEARQAKKAIAENKDELTAANLPFAGNPNGDVTVVEFFDYNCGYCKHAVGDVVKVLEKDSNVKVIFHEMPILSDTSTVAARYALAAHKQGKYFEFHKELMQSGGPRNEDTLEKIGQDLGLNVEQMRKDANSADVRAEIEKSSALARKLGIRGTPAFIIGDVFAPGYMTYDAMLDTIKQVRDGKG